MIRRPPRSTRTDTLFPYTTLFRSLAAAPVAVAPATNAAATIKTGSAPAAEAAAPQIDMPPLEDAVSVEASVVKTEPAKAPRSEERRVGKECVSTCRSRWLPLH